MDSAQDEPILQLIYASAQTTPFDDEALLALLEVARTNNEDLGVTGMLLYHEGSFIQVLEGPEATVEALYAKIGEDPRHHRTQVLFSCLQPERDFDGWSMGFHRIDPDHDDLPAGFSDFLTGGTLALNDADGGLFRNLLLGFREGRFHAV